MMADEHEHNAAIARHPGWQKDWDEIEARALQAFAQVPDSELRGLAARLARKAAWTREQLVYWGYLVGRAAGAPEGRTLTPTEAEAILVGWAMESRMARKWDRPSAVPYAARTPDEMTLRALAADRRGPDFG